MLVLLLIFMFSHVEAQSPSSQNDFPTPGDITDFKPTRAFLISILAVMFVLTFLLLSFAKFCHTSPSRNDRENSDGILRSGSSYGIDKTVIESLPFFKFSSLKGWKEGLECAVCLSKFEDNEFLRLLPKCKHAFHINCVDQWLEKNSSCPLCRNKVSANDIELLAFSNSLRFLKNRSELPEDSNLEILVQREESRKGSLSFGFGSSFRKFEKVKKEEVPVQEKGDLGNGKVFHKYNHKIVASDVVFKNRWSNVSSSDLMFLEAEMRSSMASNGYPCLETKEDKSAITRVVVDCEIAKYKKEMEIKSVFGNEEGESDPNEKYQSRVLNQNEKRSMSEIIVHTRFQEFGSENGFRDDSSSSENVVKDEKMKRLWLPIARKTAEWFANREQRSQISQTTRPSLNV